MRTVRPVLKTVLPVVVASALLAGCAGPTPVDDASIDRWQARQDADAQNDDDSLGVLYGRMRAGDSESVDRVNGGVGLTLPAPVELRSVVLSCFGRGTLRGYLLVESGSTSRSAAVDDVRCGARPHAVRLPRSWRREVDHVAFHAVAASRDTAWQVRIH